MIRTNLRLRRTYSTPTNSIFRQPKKLLVVFAFVIGVLIHLPKLFTGLNENNSFRQSQTVMLVREFVRRGLDIESPVPIFGPQSKIPFELPIFQFLASILSKISDLNPIVATRLTGFVFFLLSGAVIFLLMHRFLGFIPGYIGLILFLFSPYALMWGVSATIEFCAVFLMLLAIYSLINVFDERHRRKNYSLLIFTIALMLSGLVKITTAVAMSPLFLLAFKDCFLDSRIKELFLRFVRISKILVIPMALVIIVNLMWIRFADSVKSQSKYTSHLSSRNLSGWNYGSIQDRFDFSNLFQITNIYWGPIIGGLGGFFIFSFVGLFLSDKNVSIPVLLSIACGPLIFLNLYAVHDYYSIAIFPSIIFLMAIGFKVLVKYLPQWSKEKKFGALSIFLVYLFLVTGSSQYGKDYLAHKFFLPHGIPYLAEEIRNNSPRTANVVYVGCDWSPLIPYYVDRSALMIPPWKVELNKSDFHGFQVVLFCEQNSESSKETRARIQELGFKLRYITPNLYLLEGGTGISN